MDGVTFLGAGVDHDADGQPGPTALGDDQADGNDDEDGVVFNTVLRPGPVGFARCHRLAAGPPERLD